MCVLTALAGIQYRAAGVGACEVRGVARGRRTAAARGLSGEGARSGILSDVTDSSSSFFARKRGRTRGRTRAGREDERVECRVARVDGDDAGRVGYGLDEEREEREERKVGGGRSRVAPSFRRHSNELF